MSIPTSRTKVVADITIDQEKCVGCGKCITVCKDFNIELKDKKAHATGQGIFGCMACGHCMAICPESAIKINGRFLSPDDIFSLPAKEESIQYGSLMKPFWGKETDELFRGFMRPLIDRYISSMKKGENIVNYDAPVALYFYGTPYCDPCDPIIAATYAMIAAESLGLGTCMLGAIHPFIQSGKAAKRFRQKHGILSKSREGLFLIMGYPNVKYHKGIRRSFASIN